MTDYAFLVSGLNEPISAIRFLIADRLGRSPYLDIASEGSNTLTREMAVDALAKLVHDHSSAKLSREQIGKNAKNVGRRWYASLRFPYQYTDCGQTHSFAVQMDVVIDGGVSEDDRGRRGCIVYSLGRSSIRKATDEEIKKRIEDVANENVVSAQRKAIRLFRYWSQKSENRYAAGPIEFLTSKKHKPMETAAAINHFAASKDLLDNFERVANPKQCDVLFDYLKERFSKDNQSTLKISIVEIFLAIAPPKNSVPFFKHVISRPDSLPPKTIGRIQKALESATDRLIREEEDNKQGGWPR